MYIVEVRGYKIEARVVGLQETEITVNGKYYDTYYGNYLNCPGDFISPLAADIRAGFVPFVGWPEDNKADDFIIIHSRYTLHKGNQEEVTTRVNRSGEMSTQIEYSK